MSRSLPPVGTFALLDSLTAFVPDDFINARWPSRQGRGPRCRFSAAQLWRVHLLATLTGGRSFNALHRSLTEQPALRRFAHLPNERSVPDVRMLHEFRRRLGTGGWRAINDQLIGQLLLCAPLREKTVALIDATDLPARTQDQDKATRSWSARRATLGARSMKPGHTRFYVGYKKHTLRLWISGFEPFVLLVPLVSWAAPAGVPESRLLKPSLRYCRERLDCRPDFVVGDMAYIHQETKRYFRTQWQMAVLTKMKADMKAWCTYSEDRPLRCAQGKDLVWRGYDSDDQKHWFEPVGEAPLCRWCWHQHSCPRQFAHAAEEHESFFGMIPLNTTLADRLLRSVRSWIEPAQSFEKNQLGLKAVFLNSLTLCWTTCLLADSAVLLRSLAILSQPATPDPLRELTPHQTLLQFD
jgi:hypothetical protein